MLERARGGGLRGALCALAAVLCLAAGPPAAGEAPAAAEERAGSSWDDVLAAHVVDGGVDYAGLKADQSALEAYAEWLASRPKQGGGCGEELAFWINAYNASVLRLVVAAYPALASVRDIPGFFSDLRVSVAGGHLTLDEIEERALQCGDARVHFALVCAARSCPPLRGESYDGDTIDLQLEDQTRRFLNDPERGASWVEDSRTLRLSMLFEWYRDDFSPGAEPAGSENRLLRWVLPYLAPGLAERIAAGGAGLEFLDYDWSLNDRRRPGAAAAHGLATWSQELPGPGRRMSKAVRSPSVFSPTERPQLEHR